MSNNSFYGICENKSLLEIKHDNITGTVPITKGGTGAITARDAISNLNGVEKTTSEIAYYVSTSGSDSNTGTSSESAFRTIQHAINILPKYLMHSVRIYVASGTYNEYVSIGGFSGRGEFTLEGNFSSKPIIFFIIVEGNNNRIKVNNFQLTSTYLNAALICQYNKTVEMSNIKTINSGMIGMSMTNGGRYRLEHCEISNKDYGFSCFNSILTIASNSGSNNTYGLFLVSGGICINEGSGIPSATTSTYINGGRLI